MWNDMRTNFHRCIVRGQRMDGLNEPYWRYWTKCLAPDCPTTNEWNMVAAYDSWNICMSAAIKHFVTRGNE
jgi:hypothetical protein